MFLGHFATGFAAKPLAPKIPLWVLIVAAQFIDILCLGVFLPLGIERSNPASPYIPWSHGLFMAGVWTLAAGLIAFTVFREFRLRATLVIMLLVFGHWVLDFISHPMGLGKPLPPDIPLFFDGSPKIGLGLYQTMPAALICEFGLLAIGVWIYIQYRKEMSRKPEIKSEGM